MSLFQQLEYEIGSTVHETLVRRRLHVDVRPGEIRRGSPQAADLHEGP